MLEVIFARQAELQARSFGVDLASLSDEDRSRFIRDMTLACTDELHEALAEVGWKPWASSRHVNRDAFVGELIDALHFLVNLFLAVGASADEVTERYMAKADVNRKRQEDGYDGVNGKCTTCKRAFDDPAGSCASCTDHKERMQ